MTREKPYTMKWGLILIGVVFALFAACTPAPTATPVPTVTPTPAPTPTPKPARLEDNYEPDNSIDLARTITGAELHNFCGAKEEDWVKFAAAAGQTYHVKADPPSNFPTEPRLEIFVNGKSVAQNDHYFGNIAEVWWWNNGSDTTAYVRVTEIKARADCGSSTYTLSVQAGKP